MKDVESTKGNDGTIALISKRNNIKLDKLTTYVLAPGDWRWPANRFRGRRIACFFTNCGLINRRDEIDPG